MQNFAIKTGGEEIRPVHTDSTRQHSTTA